MRSIKVLEIVLMLAAATAFATAQYEFLVLVLFLMGCQSTLFGPVKYAYLPQQLARAELIGGNALVESGTYIAIILGLLTGGLAVAFGGDGHRLIASILVVTAIAGYVTSRLIPVTRAVDPGLSIGWNPVPETWRILRYSARDRHIFLSILGISWFWFFGSAITLQVPAYTLDILNGNEAITTVLLVAFAVGVGIGSLLCEKLSGKRIELGLVPLGSIGLSVFAVDLWLIRPTAALPAVASATEFIARPGSTRILFDLAMLGAFGGLYSVPLYAYVQARARLSHLSRVIAANNIINALFMVAAAGLAMLLLHLGLTIPELFLVIAGLNALVAIFIYTLLPEFMMRFVAWLIVSLLYRIRATGLEHIPNSGPAVLVCNHVSFVDALLIGGMVGRPVRFVMWYRIFDIPLFRFLFRTAKAIPIASAREDREILDRALEQIDAELENGNLVCIFPEGEITRDGHVGTFRPGIERIIERRPVPVVPLAIAGLWGSWFSRNRGGGLRRIPGKLLARVDLRVAAAVRPAQVSAAGLEAIVRTLRGRTR